MFTSPVFTNPRSQAADLFNSKLASARRHAFLAKLTGKSTALTQFTGNSHQGRFNRRSLGIKDILVEQVAGTLHRGLDFDEDFRPLRKNLRERWINLYLLMTAGDVPPIVVYMLGEKYYIEDGHHRLSVARALGIRYIQAEVWEYARQVIQPVPPCCPVHCYRVKPDSVWQTNVHMSESVEC
jgi:hypothetical protein